MKIELAKHSGFCTGVRNAVNRIVDEINNCDEDILINGPLIHSPQTVKILEKRGVTTYHICYEVDDINSSVSELRKQKFVQLFKPVEAVALNNQKICYLFNKDVGLIELVEIKQ